MPIVFPADSDYLWPGVHAASVADVEAALVAEFGKSMTRRPIFDEWVELRARIAGLTTLRNQWVDGSFATRKRDPRDIDVATFLDGVEVDGLASDDQEALNALMGSASTETFPLCDSFALVEYPAGHPMHEVYLATKQVFETTLYGYDSRTDTVKGFVEVAP